MATAAALLKQVESKRQDIDSLEQRIAAAAGQVYEQRQAAAAELKSLEEQARQAAKRHTSGSTILGTFLQLVFSEPSPKLDADKVQGLLDEINKNRPADQQVQFADLCSTGAGSWSIRKRGKG